MFNKKKTSNPKNGAEFGFGTDQVLIFCMRYILQMK